VKADRDLSRFAPHRSSLSLTSDTLDIIESEQDGYIAITAPLDASDMVGWRVLRTGIGSLSQAERIVDRIEKGRERERSIVED
jgi:hypothetical protein